MAAKKKAKKKAAKKKTAKKAAPAKKVKAIKEPMTKSALYTELAERTELKKKDIVADDDTCPEQGGIIKGKAYVISKKRHRRCISRQRK